MPFTFGERQRAVLPTPIPLPDRDLTPVPTFGEALGSGFAIDNTIVSTINRLSDERFEPVVEYNPFVDDDLAGYPLGAFSFSESPRETQAIRDRLDQERMNRAVLDKAPWYISLPARVLAGAADPLVWIPVGGAAMRGGKVASSALKFAGAAAAGEVLTEVPLQMTQQERTVLESGLNIAGAGLIGGVIGGAVGKWAAKELPFESKPLREVGEGIDGDMSHVDVSIESAARQGPQPPTAPSQEELEALIAKDIPKAELPPQRGAAAQERKEATEFLLRDPYAEAPPPLEAEIVLLDDGTEILLPPDPADFVDPIPNVRAAYREEGTGLFGRVVEEPEAPPLLGEARRIGGEGEPVFEPASAASQQFNSTKKEIVDEVDGSGINAINTEQASRLMVAKDRWFQVASKLFPNARMETSPLKSAVAVVERLAEQVLPRLKNLEGKASEFAVESGQKNLRGRFVQIKRGLREFYQQHLEAGGRLQFKEFKEQVSAAMRRGDKHADAAVAGAARTLVRPHYSVVRDFATRMGVPGFKADDLGQVKFAESYLNRIIDRNSIRREVVNENGETFRQMLVRVFEDEDVARAIEFRIDGLTNGKTFDDALVEVAAARKRTLAIPDTELEPWLVNDIEKLSELYLRTVGTDAYLLRAGAGDISGKAFREAIVKEADELIGAAKTPKEKLRLRKRRDADLADMDLLIARLRHEHLGADSGGVRRFMDSYRSVSVILRLPNIALASVPDMARTIMTQGFVRAVGSGWLPMLRSFKGAKLAKRHLSAMGTAIDQEINHTLHEITLTGRVGESGPLDHAVDAFAKWTGMRWWTSTQKAIAGGAVQAEVLHLGKLVAKGKATKAQVAKLARLGLDAPRVGAVMRQFDEFGETIEGNLIPNISKWTDLEAAELYQAAIVKEVDAIIVTPGIGDRPALFDDSIVRAFFQFRGFGLASIQKTVALGASDFKLGNRLQVIEGAMGLVALGGLVDEIRRRLAGDDRELSNWQRAARAVDRSGVTGIFSDWTRTFDTMSGGLLTDIVDPEDSRRRGGSPGNQFAQAIFGLPYRDVRNAVDVVHGIAAAATGEQVTRGQLRAAASFVPLSNWWAMRIALNKLEAGERVEDFFDVPPAPPR